MTKESPAVEIYELELHEVLNRSKYEWCMRVPNGWVYTTAIPNLGISSTFVPFNSEFKNNKK